MNRMVEWINEAAVAWGSYVLHAGWQAALVGLVLVVVVNGAGRRWPAPFRYALLVVALLKFACPPLLPFPTGVFTQLSASPISPLTLKERKPAQATEPQGKALGASAGASGLAFPAALLGAGEGQRLRWLKGFMALHLTGTAVVLALILRRAARLRALALACRARLRAGLREQYRDLAIEMGVYRIPLLGISDHVDAPMAFSAPKAAIMLPTKIVGRLSAEELKAVLAHELAHCRRGDLWLNWVQLFLLALWWFHPIVWLVNRSLQDVREDCCDDLLLARRIVSNDDYCDVLMRAASELCPAFAPAGASGLNGRLHPLGRRMARIADWTLRRSESVSWSGAVAVLLAAAVLLPGARQAEAGPGAGSPSASAESEAPLPSRRVAPPAATAQSLTSQPRQIKAGPLSSRLPNRPATLPASPPPSAPRDVSRVVPDGVRTTATVAATARAGQAPAATAETTFRASAVATPQRVPIPVRTAVRALRPPTPGILEASPPGARLLPMHSGRR